MQINDKMVATTIYGEMGKGGKKAYHPVEFSDTRKSKQVARLLIVVSEGVCEELTEVYLNNIPHGNFNCTIDWRAGTPDQTPITGFTEVTNPSTSFAPFVNMTTVGLYQAAVDWEAQAAIITFTTSLMRDVWDAGDVVMSKAVHSIYTRPNSSATWTLYRQDTVWAKVSNPWSWDIRVQQPVGTVIGVPWEIKVTRDNPDDASAKTESKVSWTGLTEVHEITLNYPNTALVGITLHDASQFGGQIPDILFRIKGIRVKIPSNYNPVARTYTGIWDGLLTSVTYYTNNPAWVLFDVLNSSKCLNIPIADIDVPAIYSLSVACDELVTDGKGGFEPRYTVNNQFAVRENIPTFLMYLLSICNADITTNEFGQISVMFDRRDQAVTKIVTNANVIGGLFSYSSNDLEQRTSLCNVTYNNMGNYGKTDTATWEDEDLTTRYGLQTVDVPLVGCSSEAQAIRKARWVVYQNGYLTNIINFKVLFEGLNYRRGEIVKVVDNDAKGGMFAGKILSFEDTGTTLILHLDRLLATSLKAITYMDEAGAVITANGTYSTSSGNGLYTIPINNYPAVGSAFIGETYDNLDSETVQAYSLYKIIKVDKQDDVYSITAIQHATSVVTAGQNFHPTFLLHLDTIPTIDSSLNTLSVTNPVRVPDLTTGVFGNGITNGYVSPQLLTGMFPESDDFTVAFRYRTSSFISDMEILTNGAGHHYVICRAGKFNLLDTVDSGIFVENTSFYAVRFERKSGVAYLYVDGVLVAQTAYTRFISNEQIMLGTNSIAYADEYMYLQGVALAAPASSYTVETSPYTA